MTNEQIVAALKEEINLLYNCTDDPDMKAYLRWLKTAYAVERCKCPRCGNKFDAHEGMKYAKKIISIPIK